MSKNNEDEHDFWPFVERRISRRKFLAGCTAALALMNAPMNLSKLFAAARAAEKNAVLTWSLSPETTQTFAWNGREKGREEYLQVLEYTKAEQPDWSEAASFAAKTEPFPTNMGEKNICFATALQLQPGNHYLYRVGSAAGWSAVGEFHTSPADVKAFTCLLFGDSQSGLPETPDYSPWKKTLHAAVQAHPEAAFFMNLGDLVEIGQDYAHWREWYGAAADVLQQLPFMPVLGNHETYDTPDEEHSTLPLYFLHQFYLPENGPQGLQRQVYSFDYGPVHFSVLDSQFQEEQSERPDLLADELHWLEQDLADSRQPWKVVCFHKTPYYNKAVRANEALKKALLPILDKYQVDLVINGHDHAYSRTYPLRGDHFGEHPSEGTIYLITGRSGRKCYADLSAKLWDAFFYDPQAEPNYIVLHAEPQVLTLMACSQSGRVIDHFEIDKQNDQLWPKLALPQPALQPELVLWGRRLSPAVYPLREGRCWYIPLQSFFEASGGHLQPLDQGGCEVIYAGKTMDFSMGSSLAMEGTVRHTLLRPLRYKQEQYLLSAEDIEKLFGFSWHYDPMLRFLFLAH